VKDAVGSAVDVMQAMGSSICSLLSKVSAYINFLVHSSNREMAAFIYLFISLLIDLWCFAVMERVLYLE